MGTVTNVLMPVKQSLIHSLWLIKETSLANVQITDPLFEAPNPVVTITYVSGDDDADNELDVNETWFTLQVMSLPLPILMRAKLPIADCNKVPMKMVLR